MQKFIFQLLLEIILFCLLFSNVFVLKKLDGLYTVLCLISFLILILLFLRYRKPIKQKFKDANFIITGLSIIVLGLMYLIGLFSGFVSTYSPLSTTAISLGKWILVIISVILTELIRYVIAINKSKKQKRYIITEILMLLNFVLIDMSLYPKVFIFNSSTQICEFFCIFLVQSLAKNLMLNSISTNYSYVPCLYYRLFMDLYIFLLPIKPNINTFIESVIFLVFPYLVYITIKEITEKRKIELSKTKRKSNYLWNGTIIILIGILVMLVSCEFKYGMLAVGSKSMTGTINKGDAIIYKKYAKEKNLKEGQIIVFEKNNVMIIHRIVSIYKISEQESVYKTKGDANEDNDNWLVKQEEIIGTVDTRVPWIAWPSVLLNGIFY